MARINVGLYADLSLRSEAETLDIVLDLLRELDADAANKYIADNAVYFESDDADWWVYEMMREVSDLISEKLPDYQYADYDSDAGGWGIWVSWESIQDDIDSGELATFDAAGNLVVKAGTMPTLAVHINDHGNATLYRLRVETEEVWSVV